MIPEIGKQYILLDTFAFSGLGWESGTVVTCTALDIPHLPNYCICNGEPQPELGISTPVELLSPLQTRRRRKRTPTPEETAPRRRRRRKRE